jgi:type II secretory pathway pseudopilin PulG
VGLLIVGIAIVIGLPLGSQQQRKDTVNKQNDLWFFRKKMRENVERPASYN